MVWAIILVAWLAGASGANAAMTECTTRPAAGGGSITTCRGVRGDLAQQYRTRPAIGGGTITTGGRRTCITRRATGGGTATTCRETP
jgi:hypothetical protein